MQFTSDLLPSDLIGVSVYERQRGEFVFHPGPVFAQVLLADEINRAGPRTQSALLEAMEERQVSVDGMTRALPSPFFVIATQNPGEQLGTHPLPESQLDRFAIRLSLGYPPPAAERALLAGEDRRALLGRMQPVMTPDQWQHWQAQIERVHVAPGLLDYLQALIAATRNGQWFAQGVRAPGCRCCDWPGARAGDGARSRVARRHPATVAARHSAPADTAAPVRTRRRQSGQGLAGVRSVAMTQAAPTVWQRGRARWAQWWLSRLIPGDELTLTHRNLYILPSRSGWSLAAVTLVLLLASINEEVNLGYALAFALAGAALAALHQTHDNLRGLRLQLQPPSSAHAGDALTLTVTLDGGAGTRGRHGLRLEVLCEPASPALEVELEAGEAQWVELSVPAARRGRHPLPRIRVTSAYPLGIFRVWAWWRPASAVLIWPRWIATPPSSEPVRGPGRGHRARLGAPPCRRRAGGAAGLPARGPDALDRLEEIRRTRGSGQPGKVARIGSHPVAGL